VTSFYFYFYTPRTQLQVNTDSQIIDSYCTLPRHTYLQYQAQVRVYL